MSHEGISTDEMLKDIADTQAEIIVMEREEAGFRLLGDRWSVMRADSRKQGIKERREFIAKVQALVDEQLTAPTSGERT